MSFACYLSFSPAVTHTQRLLVWVFVYARVKFCIYLFVYIVQMFYKLERLTIANNHDNDNDDSNDDDDKSAFSYTFANTANKINVLFNSNEYGMDLSTYILCCVRCTLLLLLLSPLKVLYMHAILHRYKLHARINCGAEHWQKYFVGVIDKPTKRNGYAV